ncbi:MAG: hypothetical protein ACE145_16620 [Terriglobia bacterium]
MSGLSSEEYKTLAESQKVSAKIVEEEWRESLTPEQRKAIRLRSGMGRLTSVDGWQPADEKSAELQPQNNIDSADEILTRKVLTRSDDPRGQSADKAREDAADTIGNVLSQTTQANRRVLIRVLEVGGPDESLGSTAAGIDAQPMQVKRAFDDAREILANEARRIKRPVVAVHRVFDNLTPWVPWDELTHVHYGSVLTHWTPTVRRATIHPRIEPVVVEPIKDLSRPKKAARVYVEHPSFGRCLILRERQIDSGPVLDIECEDGARRTVLKCAFATVKT